MWSGILQRPSDDRSSGTSVADPGAKASRRTLSADSRDCSAAQRRLPPIRILSSTDRLPSFPCSHSVAPLHLVAGFDVHVARMRVSSVLLTLVVLCGQKRTPCDRCFGALV